MDIKQLLADLKTDGADATQLFADIKKTLVDAGIITDLRIVHKLGVTPANPTGDSNITITTPTATHSITVNKTHGTVAANVADVPAVAGATSINPANFAALLAFLEQLLPLLIPLF